MFRYLPYLSLLLSLMGCGDITVEPTDELGGTERVFAGGKADEAGHPDSCTITMCLTGAMDHRTPSNHAFRRLCDDLRIDGVQLDCHGDQCNTTFDSFLQFPLLTVYPALVDALDRNFDGSIDDADPVCEINLIGFSWGGVNALSIAGHLSRDARIPETHRQVTRAVLLDAFQPFSAERMTVPDNVKSVLSMRQSSSPHHDCSRSAPLGPYQGLTPICSDEQDCHDYDYSLAADVYFSHADGNYTRGDQIGHCMVPSVAHESVIEFLQDLPLTGRLPEPVVN